VTGPTSLRGVAFVRAGSIHSNSFTHRWLLARVTGAGGGSLSKKDPPLEGESLHGRLCVHQNKIKPAFRGGSLYGSPKA